LSTAWWYGGGGSRNWGLEIGNQNVEYAEFAALLAELYPKRERSLYADIEYAKIADPALEYSRQDAEETLARTQEMVGQIESLLEGHR
jgi:HEPN domain-containing protein